MFAFRRSGHMGAHQYCDHAGKRGDCSMSGARLWAEAELSREAEGRHDKSNKAAEEQELLSSLLPDVTGLVPPETKIIELGAGTVRAFRKKTKPLLLALNSPEGFLVDQSPAFLRNIVNEEPTLKLTPVFEDFFDGPKAGPLGPAAMLICAFGNIIGNIVAPVRDALPDSELAAALRQYAAFVDTGWLLVTFNSDPDGHKAATYYAKHPLFQLNIFDRMAVELPVSGDFDPEVFLYETEWHAASLQLAHLAVAQRDLSFALADETFSVRAGDRYHIKNSFHFTPEFFEDCAIQARLSLVKRWTLEQTHAFLLRKER